VRYVVPRCAAATTDFSITAILEETFVVLREPVAIVLGPDETLQGSAAEVFRRFSTTRAFWRAWVRNLASRSNGRRTHPRGHHLEAQRVEIPARSSPR